MAKLPVPIARRRRRVREPLYVTAMSVLDLYGTISYKNISIQPDNDAYGRLSVIYGDNGAGKTTLLRLLYSTLSQEVSSGLRTYLAKTPFRQFSVSLSDSTTIVITKDDLIGDYDIKVRRQNRVTEMSVTCSEDGKVRAQDSIAVYESILKSIDFDVLFVDHNRAVRSTYPFLSEISNLGFERDYEYYETYDGLEHKRIRQSNDSSIQFPLHQIVQAVDRWLRNQAYRQGATGEQNASAVYLEITKALVRRKKRKSGAVLESDLTETLASLDVVTESFVRHGLLSPYPFKDLALLYSGASNTKKRQIEDVLIPFLDSIQRRISALNEIHEVMTVFEFELNRFFGRKTAFVDIFDGLSIKDNEGTELELSDLSSGEKQLVFLLSAAVVSRSTKSLILIDEPELSLNYKWQRLIAEALSNVSAATSTQFVLASHSVEIISRHVTASVELA